MAKQQPQKPALSPERALYQAVSLCRKAGALTMGFDAVEEAVVKGKAAAALLAAAQAQVLSQMDLLGKLKQRPLADQAGPDAGQIAFRPVGVGVEQIIR